MEVNRVCPANVGVQLQELRLFFWTNWLAIVVFVL